jgi:hypothetical protein
MTPTSANMKKSKHSPIVNWLFANKSGRIVIIQIPNVALWVAIVAWVGMRFVSIARWHLALEILFNGALIVWAIMEIGWGASRFRRMLGAVVLGWVFVGLAIRFLH